MFKTTVGKAKIMVTLARAAACPNDLTVNTVHGVKGEGADAVLFVLSADVEMATKLIAAWRDRTMDDEAQRVAYVGVTRAKRFLALAVPEVLAGKLVGILRERAVSLEEAPVCRREKIASQRQNGSEKKTSLEPY